MNDISKNCPECGERLSVDARRCVCGWGAKKERAGEIVTDMRCRWETRGLRCCYPVGRFELGAKSGKCIFHRACSDNIAGARIVHESQGASPAEYLTRAKAFMYPPGDNANVAATRAKLKKPGNFASFLPADLLPPREPGADESEGTQ